jgi:hypothetical protein
MRPWFGLVAVMAAVACGGSAASEPQAPAPAASGSGGSSVVLDAGDTPPTPPKGALLCPDGVCNYQSNAGCVGATGCVPDPLSDAAVVPRCSAAGTTAFGGSCTSWTDCVPGGLCAGGVCRKLCCGKDWTGCPSSEHCLSKLEVLSSADAAVWSGAYLCLPTTGCDPLVASSCASGQACQIVDPTGATDCVPGPAAGAGLAGLACPCQTGLVCSSDLCRSLCRTTGGELSCPAGDGRCVHFSTDPQGVGECVP